MNISYTIMHVNDRAKKYMDYNRNVLKDYTYIDNIEFFNGVTGRAWDTLNSLGIPLDRWKPYDGRSMEPLPGEYGVWISTIRTMQYIVDNNIENLLVLEDDILLDKDFVHNLLLCVEELPKDYSFLSLFYPGGQNDVSDSTEIGARYIHKANNQHAAAVATLYSNDGARKILKLAKRKGMEYTSDCFIFRQAQLGAINGFSIKPNDLVFVEHNDHSIKSIIDPDNIRNTREEINVYLKEIPYYYINLDKDVHRRIALEEHFSVNKIRNYVRVKAVDTSSCEKHPNLSHVETACALSHIAAIREFVENSSADLAIICEDDVDLTNINVNKIDIKDLLATEDDLCVQLAVSTDLSVNMDFSMHEKRYSDYGAISYLINRKYAKKLIDAYGDDLLFNKFPYKEEVHPNGGITTTRPVADELVYSLCTTLTFPIFTLFSYQSNIVDTQERIAAVLKNIEEFNTYWDIKSN